MPAATVVGSGPNGLAAAIELAGQGWDVEVLEAGAAAGGGLVTDADWLPGFRVDHCATVLPLAVTSPFLRRLPLAVDWVRSPACLAHPFDDGSAATLEVSLEATAASLGADEERYRRLLGPLVARWPELLDEVLAPIHWPRRPLLAARFGAAALRSATGLAAGFRTPGARALLAGIAAHAAVPLTSPGGAAFALVLAVAGHAAGWPLVRGGAGALAAALADHLHAAGGRIRTGVEVRDLATLGASTVLLDLAPPGVLRVAGDRLPPSYRRRLAGHRPGPGAFRIDWVLDGPIPWRSAACTRAATVHLGGTFEEVAAAEAAPWQGSLPPRPFVILVQPTRFDPSRAPAGGELAWAYAHVPNGSAVDATAAIEDQVERFAPGFRRRVVARRAAGPRALEARNPNLVGGDIGGGANTLRGLLLRPAGRPSGHATPVPGLFLCSSSTPPGGGVHFMCGVNAARAATRRR